MCQLADIEERNRKYMSTEQKYQIIGKVIRTPEDKKKYFQMKLLDRIQCIVGENNPDQEIKEDILLKICSKITSVYVGCFEKIEQTLGEEVWAYRVTSEVFNQFTPEEQEMYKRRAKLWNDCRLNIKDIGSKVIDDVIDILNNVTFINK